MERPRRVLLVDDPLTTSALEILMTLLGHRPVSVATGAAAIETYLHFDPDAAIIDIGLPDIDGCEVARRIRAVAGSRAPLLVALTGWNRPEDRARIASAGFDHHLLKPSSVEEIDRLLLARSLPTELPR